MRESEVLFEVIFFADLCLGRIVLMREIRPEPRAEVDMPAPQPPQDGLGITVVVRAEAAGGAGVGGLIVHIRTH